MEDTLAEDIRAAVTKHLEQHPPEGATLPYLMHWVMTFSVGDLDNKRIVYIRAVHPDDQPHYVTNGLMHEGIEFLNDFGIEE